MIKVLMTRDEVAEILSVSTQTVDNLRKVGTLTWVSIGRGVRIHGASVEALIGLDGHKKEPSPGDPTED
jgi:excisionase family DNA binding protein